MRLSFEIRSFFFVYFAFNREFESAEFCSNPGVIFAPEPGESRENSSRSGSRVETARRLAYRCLSMLPVRSGRINRPMEERTWEGLYCHAASSKFIASRATIPRYREPFRVAECNWLSQRTAPKCAGASCMCTSTYGPGYRRPAARAIRGAPALLLKDYGGSCWLRMHFPRSVSFSENPSAQLFRLNWRKCAGVQPTRNRGGNASRKHTRNKIFRL